MAEKEIYQCFVFGTRDRRTGEITPSNYKFEPLENSILFSDGFGAGCQPIMGYKIQTRFPELKKNQINFCVAKIGALQGKTHILTYDDENPQFAEEYIPISPTHDFVFFGSVVSIDLDKSDDEIRRVLTSKFFTDKKLYLSSYTTSNGQFIIDEKSR